MSYNQEQIRKQFDLLSPKIQAAIANLDMGTITDGLRKKYNLHVDELGRIAEEITATMVGLTNVRDFSRNIKAQTGLSDDVINLITYDINQQIFSKIRKELEELSQGVKAPSEKELGQSSAPAMFDTKMTSVTNVPKQEVAVTAQTGDNGKVAPTRDPYHEPI